MGKRGRMKLYKLCMMQAKGRPIGQIHTHVYLADLPWGLHFDKKTTDRSLPKPINPLYQACKFFLPYHCFFPFFFRLLPLLLPALLEKFPGLVDGLSLEVLPGKSSNMPACAAFCNHSKNSSSVMPSSRLDDGIAPPRCPELVPFPLLCFAVKLGFT